MIRVRVPTPLRPMTGGKSEIEMEGNTIAQLIENLGAAHPGLKERLYDEKGEVRRFINIYVNEEGVLDERTPGTPGYWDPTDPRPWARHYAIGENR